MNFMIHKLRTQLPSRTSRPRGQRGPLRQDERELSGQSVISAPRERSSGTCCRPPVQYYRGGDADLKVLHEPTWAIPIEGVNGLLSWAVIMNDGLSERFLYFSVQRIPKLSVKKASGMCKMFAGITSCFTFLHDWYWARQDLWDMSSHNVYTTTWWVGRRYQMAH